MVNVQALKDFAATKLAIAKESGGVAGNTAGDTLVKDILSIPGETITYAAARQLRTRASALADEFSMVSKNAPGIGIAKKLGGLADEAIQRDVGAQAPELLATMNATDDAYAANSARYNNRLIKSIVKAADPAAGGHPQSVVKTVFKPGNVSDVNSLKNAVDPGDWTKVQTWVAQDLMAKATTDGVLQGPKLTEVMFGRNGLGRQVMEATYGPEQVTLLEKVANAATVNQAKQAEGTGKMLIQLTQGGALFGLAGGALGGAGTALGLGGNASPGQIGLGAAGASAAVILLGPYALSKIMTNALGSKWLIHGLKLPAGSPQAAATLGRIMASVNEPERSQLFPPQQQAMVKMMADRQANQTPTAIQDALDRVNMASRLR